MKERLLFLLLLEISIFDIHASLTSGTSMKITSCAPLEVALMLPINFDELPLIAKQIIINFFDTDDVITCQRANVGKRYVVRLRNKIKIFFNESGHWISIDCGKQKVPENLIPSKIRNNVAKKYGPYVFVVKIRKLNKNKINILLNNGVYLSFHL